MMPTALIVEDEPEANKLLSMLVQLRGYRTDSAFTGGEALAKIDHAPPDIVFLDLMLPDINGYEVCKSVKQSPSTALIPVVMVTARVALENRIQSYSLGADQYVPKPYTPDQIFRAMEDADDWRRNLDRNSAEGEIRFGSSDEGETIRQLAQLRSLLVAGTTLESDAVTRLIDVLKQLGASADEWGQKHGVSEVAILSYKKDLEWLSLTISDLAGWLVDDMRPPAERWPDVIARGRFDEVSVHPSGRSFTLVKALP